MLLAETVPVDGRLVVEMRGAALLLPGRKSAPAATKGMLMLERRGVKLARRKAWANSLTICRVLGDIIFFGVAVKHWTMPMRFA
jgi:hypothetical protein